MNVLLDTHAVLGLVSDPDQIAAPALAMLCDPVTAMTPILAI